MNLSSEAINDLRRELAKLYGTDFALNDNELNEIGIFLLSSLAETIKFGKTV